MEGLDSTLQSILLLSTRLSFSDAEGWVRLSFATEVKDDGGRVGGLDTGELEVVNASSVRPWPLFCSHSARLKEERPARAGASAPRAIVEYSYMPVTGMKTGQRGVNLGIVRDLRKPRWRSQRAETRRLRPSISPRSCISYIQILAAAQSDHFISWRPPPSSISGVGRGVGWGGQK